MRIVQVFQGLRCDARAPCRKLSLRFYIALQRSFWGWRVLVRVVYLAGRRFVLDTVVLLC